VPIHAPRALALTTFVVTIALSTAAGNAQPPVERKVLLQHDLTIPGYQATLVEVRIPAGGREGRHSHPGAALVYVEEGVLTLDYEGQPTKAYKAGDSFYVEPGRIHEGINQGSATVRAIASFVAEKGKPLTTPAP
jgi:quercetin dioxygenase-like cupin family protein